ncbi:MAG: hypothetical protein HOP30_15555 [Cyclobacteriaceae bacterium]|nr:hypothetical protein [Cyclobacteriaceae bacterium]
MRSVIIILLISVQWVQAHSPDLSTLMMYEQNGKSLLLIKASLIAFEGEVDYHFGKNAYKTPEEFMQLVIKHFQKTFLVIANGDTIQLINPQVQLGHEATLFAELQIKEKNIQSYFIRCTLFQDMPNNQCELILTTQDRPQQQYILYGGNNHEVTLKASRQAWIIETPTNFISNNSVIPWLVALVILCLTGFILKSGIIKSNALNKMTSGHSSQISNI